MSNVDSQKPKLIIYLKKETNSGIQNNKQPFIQLLLSTTALKFFVHTFGLFLLLVGKKILPNKLIFCRIS